MNNISKLFLNFILAFTSVFSSAQSQRAPEIRSCLTSEYALAAMENANPQKNWDDNVEIGKALGYVIAEYYQKSIWAMDNPEIEGREALMYALQHFEQRIKYMKIDALKREVKRCRISLN